MKAQVLLETLALPSGYIMPTADTRFSLLSHTWFHSAPRPGTSQHLEKEREVSQVPGGRKASVKRDSTPLLLGRTSPSHLFLPSSIHA